MKFSLCFGWSMFSNCVFQWQNINNDPPYNIIFVELCFVVFWRAKDEIGHWGLLE